MNPDQKSLRIGTMAIVGAVALRLLSNSLPDKLVDFLTQPDVAAVMLFAETGRVIRTPEVTVTEPTEPTEETAPIEPAAASVSFDGADAALVEINNACGYSVDVAALLQTPLQWDLTSDEPTVLILHTHTCESYTGSCDNETTYRSQDESKNMLAIGSRLAVCLEAAGIGVIHDRTVHEYPSYSGSYSHARSYIKDYLAQYPSIRLVLDLHRDAMEDSSGQQIGSTVTVNGQQAAKLMLVVGTNASGQNHPNWEENMALAVKFQAQLEKLYPGLCRSISFRSQRFNQDLSTGALLIEVGAAGNTQDEALRAVELLAQGIISLADGANNTGG